MPASTITAAFAALSVALLTVGFVTDQWWPLAGGTWAAAAAAWRATSNGTQPRA